MSNATLDPLWRAPKTNLKLEIIIIIIIFFEMLILIGKNVLYTFKSHHFNFMWTYARFFLKYD